MPRKTSQTSHRTPRSPARRASSKKLAQSRRNAALAASRPAFVKRLLLHPIAVFALLVIGVVLIGISYRAGASDYTVKAVVEAAALQSGALITSPVDEQVVSSRPITVTGTCPDDAYIKLTRNGTFSGAAICAGGTFKIVTDLFVGANDLRAQAYNVTDQAGPITPSVTVSYAPPSTTTGTGTPVAGTAPQVTATEDVAGAPDAATSPLLLSSDYRFNVFTTSDLFHWGMQFHSSAAPYATHIDWGDGGKTAMTVVSDEAFTISHHYQDRGYYTIIVAATDKLQRTSTMQLAAFIKKPGDPATTGTILGPQPPLAAQAITQGTAAHDRSAWLKIAWPTYGVVIVMVASFWLGEREAFVHLMRASASGRHQPRS